MGRVQIEIECQRNWYGLTYINNTIDALIGDAIPWFFVRQPQTIKGWQNHPLCSMATLC